MTKRNIGTIMLLFLLAVCFTAKAQQVSKPSPNQMVYECSGGLPSFKSGSPPSHDAEIQAQKDCFGRELEKAHAQNNAIPGTVEAFCKLRVHDTELCKDIAPDRQNLERIYEICYKMKAVKTHNPTCDNMIPLSEAKEYRSIAQR